MADQRNVYANIPLPPLPKQREQQHGATFRASSPPDDYYRTQGHRQNDQGPYCDEGGGNDHHHNDRHHRQQQHRYQSKVVYEREEGRVVGRSSPARHVDHFGDPNSLERTNYDHSNHRQDNSDDSYRRGDYADYCSQQQRRDSNQRRQPQQKQPPGHKRQRSPPRGRYEGPVERVPYGSVAENNFKADSGGQSPPRRHAPSYPASSNDHYKNSREEMSQHGEEVNDGHNDDDSGGDKGDGPEEEPGGVIVGMGRFSNSSSRRRELIANNINQPQNQSYVADEDATEGGGGGWTKRIDPFPHLRLNLPMGGWLCGSCRFENDCRGSVCSKCKCMFAPRGSRGCGGEEDYNEEEGRSTTVVGDPIPPSKFVVFKGAIPIASTLPNSAKDAQNDNDDGVSNSDEKQAHGEQFAFSPEACAAYQLEQQRITYKPSAKKMAVPAIIAAIVAGMNSRMKYVARCNHRPVEDVPEVVIDARFWKELIEALCTPIVTSTTLTPATKPTSKGGADSDDSDLDDFLKDLDSDEEEENNNTSGLGKGTAPSPLSPEIVAKKFLIIREIHLTRISIANKVRHGDEETTFEQQNNPQQQHRGSVNVEYRMTAELDSEKDAAVLLQCTQGFLPYLGNAAVGAPLEFFTGKSNLTTPPVAAAPHPLTASDQLPQMTHMFEEVTVSVTNESLIRFAPQSDITATNSSGYSFKNFISFTHFPELVGIVGGSGISSAKQGSGSVKRPSLLPPSAQALLTDPSRSEDLRALMMLLYRRGDEHKDLLPDEQAFYDSNAASVFMMFAEAAPTTKNEALQLASVGVEKQSPSMKSLIVPGDTSTAATTGPAATTTPSAGATFAEKKAALLARLQEKHAAASSDVKQQTSTLPTENPAVVVAAVFTEETAVPPAFGPETLLLLSQATHLILGMPAPLSFLPRDHLRQ